MELKDCVVTRIHQACDAKKIPMFNRHIEILNVLCERGAPYTASTIIDFMVGVTEPDLDTLKTLADWLGVQHKWLIEGKGTRYAERLGLNGNEVDWFVEQRKMYDFDSGDQRNRALAWVLLHQHPEVVAEFCSAENGHDPRQMRVDIRVNDVELPVKKFDDLLGMLAAAMMNWKMRKSGLDSVEKSAFVQAESVLRKLHGDTYDKLGEVMMQLDNMKDNLGTLNEMAWSSYSMEAMHSIGAFSVKLPPHPEHWFDPEKHGKSSRVLAIELFAMMINGARANLFPKEHERLDKLARSIYHDLTEKEQEWCDTNISMSNKDQQ
jgi:hypothetical protein